MTPVSPVLPSQPNTLPLEIVFAKDQPEYRPLPVIRCDDGTVISRWRLTWWERLTVLCRGSFYFRQLTFNGPLQPQLPSIDEPRLTVG